MDLVSISCSAAQAACVSKDKQSNGPANIPLTESLVWIFGQSYSAIYDAEELIGKIRGLLFFTYRKGFTEIGESGITSDNGWGCMLRCGQMILGQALQRLELGRNWKWPEGLDDENVMLKFVKILSLFLDRRNCVFGIHQIALAAQASFDCKTVGTWMGPNTVIQVLRKLNIHNQTTAIKFHIALNNSVVIDEIKDVCIIQPISTDDKIAPFIWCPLLLAIPLRLGLSDINPIYIPDLKECFEMSFCIGVIGGRPNHALYFIGYVDDELLCLDPHLATQDVSNISLDSPDQLAYDQSYHTNEITKIAFENIDPSLSLCFLCETEAEFDALCQKFLDRLIRGHTSPLFEISRQAPFATNSPNSLCLTEHKTDHSFLSFSKDAFEDFEIL